MPVEIQRVDGRGKRVEELALQKVGGQHEPTSAVRERCSEVLLRRRCVEKTKPRGAGLSQQHPAVASIEMARGAPVECCPSYFFFARPADLPLERAALRAGTFLLAFFAAPRLAPFDAALAFAPPFFAALL